MNFALFSENATGVELCLYGGPSGDEERGRIDVKSDLYQRDGRRPFASINFVTAHDGFRLRDLVSYNEKHNEANGEDNRDGESHNRAWNCGAEGPTEDEGVRALRARQKWNFLATLLLSQGVPMVVVGDEMGRTQRGNNNAYCQDNEISWLDWSRVDEGLLDFTRRLIRLRERHPVFPRRGWFQGRPIHGKASDIGWLTPDGTPMAEEHWGEGHARSIGVSLNGAAIGPIHPRGLPVTDDSFYAIFNAHHESVPFTLPAEPWGRRWRPVFDTARGFSEDEGGELPCGERVVAEGRSMVLLWRAG